MTLANASEKTRGILKWIGIFLGLVLVVFLVFQIFSAFRNAFFPASLSPAQVKFQKLFPPNFPENVTGKTFSYTLDTLSGKLPDFSQQATVFRMTSKTPDLLALSKAQSLIEGIGFKDSPVRISDNVYQWRDPTRILTMDIQELNFNMISDFLSNSVQPSFTENEQSAIKTSTQFLQNMNLMPDDIDTAKTQTNLYSIKNLSLVPASSLSNTQAVQVNFFQKDFNNLPIYYPKVFVSPLNFLVGDVNQQPQVVEANFFYQSPSSESSTYPIKTASQAYDDLKKGQAYIASFAGSGDNISIKNISLGYYISEKQQDYLLPIFVFVGDNGFMAYENAITDEWTNK